MKRLPRCIVLSGGGTRCISFVGGLLYLKKKGLLATVRRWYCCSAGAFIAVLFSLGFSDEDMIKFVNEFDFSQSRDFNAGDIMSIAETFGLDKGFALRKMIVQLLESIRKGSSHWTLKEFKEETGIDVYFFISNITRSIPFYASASTHPDLFVLDAVYATMAIPLYFCPYKDLTTGDYWCDGMLGGNFPWQHVPDADKRVGIGLYFPQRPVTKKSDFFDYLNSIISFRNNYEQRKINDAWSEHVISIPTSEYPSITLDLTKEDRDYLYNKGLSEVKAWWHRQGSDKFIGLALPKNSGNHPLCATPRIRSPSLPHLAELPSDIQKFSPTLCKDSHPSQDLSPASGRLSRRWSV